MVSINHRHNDCSMKSIIRVFGSPGAGTSNALYQELCIERDLPFVPSIGHELIVANRQIHVCVKRVCWDYQSPDSIELEVEHVGGVRRAEDLIAEGWKPLPPGLD